MQDSHWAPRTCWFLRRATRCCFPPYPDGPDSCQACLPGGDGGGKKGGGGKAERGGEKVTPARHLKYKKKNFSLRGRHAALFFEFLRPPRIGGGAARILPQFPAVPEK